MHAPSTPLSPEGPPGSRPFPPFSCSIPGRQTAGRVRLPTAPCGARHAPGESTTSRSGPSRGVRWPHRRVAVGRARRHASRTRGPRLSRGQAARPGAGSLHEEGGWYEPKQRRSTRSVSWVVSRARCTRSVRVGHNLEATFHASQTSDHFRARRASAPWRSRCIGITGRQ